MKRICLSILIVLTVSSLTSVVCGDGSADEVKSLPGLHSKINFRHYSGYLSALNGSFLHYWFFESQNDPAKDPVVLWLNGGPGCSSMLGALTENGPISLKRNGSVQLNPFGWNQKANMIYLEAPPGVGFSYNLNGKYDTGDNQTAENNFAALKSFFEKFPHLKNNEFFISGESYGGIYIPTLAIRVVKNKFPKNFKGILIGNGYLDVEILSNSVLHYYYYFGLMESSTWDNVIENCCPNVSNRKCDIVGNKNDSCIRELSKPINFRYLNPYNIYENCILKDQTTQELSVKHIITNYMSLKTFPPCDDFTYLETYLNTEELKKSLHISDKSLRWTECTNLNYDRQYTSMKSTVNSLLDSGIQTLIYNGDFDTVCNFLGDKWLVFFFNSLFKGSFLSLGLQKNLEEKQ